MGPSTMATAITDSVPITLSNVPCLEPSSVNWAIFTLCFQKAMKANQKWGHFNGSITCPIPANVDKPTNDKKTAMADWDRSESVMLYMLSQRLPDSTAVRLQSITTVADCWAKVTGEFSVKSQYTKIDLLSTFSKMRCSTISEVWTFLGQMCMKREELTAIGISMTPKDY